MRLLIIVFPSYNTKFEKFKPEEFIKLELVTHNENLLNFLKAFNKSFFNKRFKLAYIAHFLFGASLGLNESVSFLYVIFDIFLSLSNQIVYRTRLTYFNKFCCE